jgi:hypothetical protein
MRGLRFVRLQQPLRSVKAESHRGQPIGVKGRCEPPDFVVRFSLACGAP